MRTVIVGAAGSIGPFIARRFAQEGGYVCIADLNADRLDEIWHDLCGLVARVEQQPVDVRSEDSVKELFGRVRDDAGGVDVLINCFAVLDQPRPAWELPLNEWRESIDVELTGVFLTCREALQLMIPQKSGRIVNLSSIAGKMAYRLRAAYAVAKAGVNALTRCLALEAGEHGITVNAICPGPVAGPRIQAVIEKRASATGRPAPEIESEYLSRTVLREFAQPEEIAELAYFLATPAARHITGQLIDVDSGYLLNP